MEIEFKLTKYRLTELLQDAYTEGWIDSALSASEMPAEALWHESATKDNIRYMEQRVRNGKKP